MDVISAEVAAELVARLGIADALSFTATCRNHRALRALGGLIWGPRARRELGRSLLLHGRFPVAVGGASVLAAPNPWRPDDLRRITSGGINYLHARDTQHCFVARNRDMVGIGYWIDDVDHPEGGVEIKSRTCALPLSDVTAGWFIFNGALDALGLRDAAGRSLTLDGGFPFVARHYAARGLCMPGDMARVADEINAHFILGCIISVSYTEVVLFLVGACSGPSGAGEGPEYRNYCSFSRWESNEDGLYCYQDLACFPVDGTGCACAWLSPEASAAKRRKLPPEGPARPAGSLPGLALGGTALLATDQAFYAARVDGIRKLESLSGPCNIRTGATKVALIGSPGKQAWSVTVYERSSLERLYRLAFPGLLLAYPHLDERGDRLGANVRDNSDPRAPWSYYTWEL